MQYNAIYKLVSIRVNFFHIEIYLFSALVQQHKLLQLDGFVSLLLLQPFVIGLHLLMRKGELLIQIFELADQFLLLRQLVSKCGNLRIESNTKLEEVR